MLSIALSHYTDDNKHHGIAHIQAVLDCAVVLKGGTPSSATPLSSLSRAELVLSPQEIAAIVWHDAAISGYGKEGHALRGALLFRESNLLHGWFTPSDAAGIEEAIRWHSKSSRLSTEFPSALAELLASADRELPKTGADLYRRSIHYHLDLGESPEQVAVSAYEHLREIIHPEYVQQHYPRLYLDRFSREVDAAYQYVQTCSLEHVRGLVANAVR